MNEGDTGQKPIQERVFGAEEYASFLEIVSFANQSVEREYKGVIKLEAEKIKVLPEVGFGDFAIGLQEGWLHPFFKEAVRKLAAEKRITMRFGIEADCIVDPYFQMIYMGGDYIEDVQKYGQTGYLRCGLTLINKAFEFSAKAQVLTTADVQRRAQRIVTASYEQMQQVAGIGSQEQQGAALAYMNEKGAQIVVRGSVVEVVVEGLRFIPPVGLRSDAAVINFLAKPVRRDFATLLANEFGLPSNERWKYEQLAEITGVGTNLSEVMKNPQIVREEADRERSILDKVRAMGFIGRLRILHGYLESKIGKVMAENL